MLTVVDFTSVGKTSEALAHPLRMLQCSELACAEQSSSSQQKRPNAEIERD